MPFSQPSRKFRFFIYKISKSSRRSQVRSCFPSLLHFNWQIPITETSGTCCQFCSSGFTTQPQVQPTQKHLLRHQDNLVIQHCPKCDPALSMGIWGGNARWVVCQHRQHSRCDVKAKTDLWKPAWSKTGWKSWFIPSHQRGAAALCCTHSGAQHMVGKALSGCPGLEQPPKVLPSVIPWWAAQSAVQQSPWTLPSDVLERAPESCLLDKCLVFLEFLKS